MAVLKVTIENADSLDEIVEEIECSGAAGPEAEITVEIEGRE